MCATSAPFVRSPVKLVLRDRIVTYYVQNRPNTSMIVYIEFTSTEARSTAV